MLSGSPGDDSSQSCGYAETLSCGDAVAVFVGHGSSMMLLVVVLVTLDALRGCFSRVAHYLRDVSALGCGDAASGCDGIDGGHVTLH